MAASLPLFGLQYLQVVGAINCYDFVCMNILYLYKCRICVNVMWDELCHGNDSFTKSLGRFVHNQYYHL